MLNFILGCMLGSIASVFILMLFIARRCVKWLLKRKKAAAKANKISELMFPTTMSGTYQKQGDLL